jgi:hypothetical protein
MYNNYYIPQSVSIPTPLYRSLQGRYFVGYADNLDFGQGLGAWAGLVNPAGSGVSIFVNVWTAASLNGACRVQIWFNASMPGESSASPNVTPSNFTIRPLPQPKAQLLYASGVSGEPQGGVMAFARFGEAGSTIVSEEDGKFIFPPGGSFSVFLSSPENPDEKASGRIALGWWEEPAKCYH